MVKMKLALGYDSGYRIVMRVQGYMVCRELLSHLSHRMIWKMIDMDTALPATLDHIDFLCRDPEGNYDKIVQYVNLGHNQA